MRFQTKNLLQLFTISASILIFDGCVSKSTSGTYTSTYSYHPYNQHQVDKSPLRTSNIKTYTQSPIHLQYNFMNQNIERTAKSMLGIEYKYGANGPSRYDCSSFTKHVFSRQGINIPRVSHDQAKVGRFIYRSQLQKGDLIFFDSKTSSRVSHVGIYLNNGQFIHASSSKKRVTISNLTSKYYREHFKWGRRVTNSSYASK